jgi:hypothetical protein
MREERVTLNKIDVERLIKSAKSHLQELGLKIINEDAFEGYHSIKAHKGGKIALVTGSVRDVELLITGTDKDYDLTLRTGAWGRDMVIPTLFGGILGSAGTAMAAGTTLATGAAVVTGTVVTAGVPIAAGATVAVVEAYRAGKFEMNFWTWLNKEIVNLGKEAMMTRPQVVVPQSSK